MASLLILPAWRQGWFAISVLLVVVGGLCAASIVLSQFDLSRRLARKEPSIVRTTDREKLRNRALLDHAPVPLLFQRTDGTLYAANRAARRLFETHGRLSEPPPSLLDILAQDRNIAKNRVIRLSPPGRASRIYAVSVGQGGGVGGIAAYAALMDVETSINVAEAQVLRDLLQVLSHEIMNSLTPIVSLSATAEELFGTLPATDTSALLGEALSTIRRRTDGLDRFVRGYRDLARLPAPDPKPVELGDLLRETARLFRARWTNRPALELVEPRTQVIVKLDRAQIEQALLNLLNNSAEATSEQENPRVQLSGESVDGAVQMVVRDNGGTIATSRREQIFEPFVSFKTNGSGIGLSLAKQIVRGHGGTLVLEDGQPDTVWTTVFLIWI